jgi:hypothetical protein
MIIKVSELFQSMKGAIGNFIVYPHPTKPGQLIGHRKGQRREPPTEAEASNQDQFAAKTRLAKRLMARPDIAAVYTALARLLRRQPFRVCLSDALKPPEIQDVSLSGYTGKPGETIAVKAVDNVEVVEVRLRIVRLDGTLIEEGKATRLVAQTGDWTYLAQSEVASGETVVVEITAVDLPGNTTVKRFDHACGPRAAA